MNPKLPSQGLFTFYSACLPFSFILLIKFNLFKVLAYNTSEGTPFC